MNEMYTCAHCGQTFTCDDMTEVASGKLVCRDCIEEHYEACDRCGGWHLIEDEELRRVNVRYGYRWSTELWCDDCVEDDAFECTDCGELYSSELLEFDEGDHLICASCSDHWRHCDDCGSLVHEDDGSWCDDDNYLCDSCVSRHENAAIHEYSYKPEPDIQGRKGEDASKEMTFGLELEVDKGDDDREETARDIIDAAEGRVYCKRDGSLDNGFEIVSHPGTLAHHTYDMHWANICRIASRAGFKSHGAGTCGLHIHVGRKQIGCPLAWGDSYRDMEHKLVVLAAKLTADLTTFSRRTQSQLNDWAQFPAIDLSMSDEELRCACRYYMGGSRYHAVNFNNSGTVEFRIFRGTLKRDTIIASIQLVSNFCKFAMEHSFEECKSATYTDIVAVNPYKELVAYSIERKLPVPAQAA